MKRYIFLTTSIRQIGGAQLYIARKIEFLNKLGWKADVFYYNSGNIKIPILKQFEKNCIDKLGLPFSFFKKRQKDMIARCILGGEKDTIIIESHTINLSFWGEYLASKVEAKHLCYLLSEDFSAIDKEMQSFFHFKLSQNLLFGISNKSISLLLPEIQESDKHCLLAVGCTSNNVEDYDDSRLHNMPSADFNILSIGRLEKSYISSMIDSVVNFANNNKKHINVIVVGDSADPSITNRIVEKIQSNELTNCIFLGYTFPIPKKLFTIADVCISSAGSCCVAYNEGIPTISIDSLDYAAIGLYGLTTKNTIYRDKEQEPQIQVEVFLKKILIDREFDSIISESKMEFKSSKQVDYSKHLQVIEKLSELNYYNINNIPRSFKASGFRLVSSIFGVSLSINLYKAALSVIRCIYTCKK